MLCEACTASNTIDAVIGAERGEAMRSQDMPTFQPHHTAARLCQMVKQAESLSFSGRDRIVI